MRKNHPILGSIFTTAGALALAGGIYFGARGIQTELEIKKRGYVKESQQLEYIIGRTTTQRDYLKAEYRDFISKPEVKKDLEKNKQKDLEMALALISFIGLTPLFGWFAASSFDSSDDCSIT